MRCPTPATIVLLSGVCKEYRTSPADGLASISNELGQLRSERPFRPKLLDSEFLDRDVIRRCSTLKYATDNHHNDIWTAGLHNRHRGMVIIVEELAITRLLNLQRKRLATTAEVLQLHDLRHNIVQQVNKICASVPRLLESGSIEVARNLLWPLYMAAQLDPETVRCDGATRDWVLGRLRFIGYETGIRQALLLVEVLSKRQEVSDLLGGNHSGGGAECVHG